MLVLYHIFIYFPVGNKAVTPIPLTDYSSVDGSFCLSRFKTEKKSGFLSFYFKIGWKSVPVSEPSLLLWLQQDLPSPCSSWTQFEWSHPREVRKSSVPRTVFRFLKIVNFWSWCFFHTVQTAGTTHIKLELSQILMKRDPLPFLSLFLPSFNCWSCCECS